MNNVKINNWESRAGSEDLKRMGIKDAMPGEVFEFKLSRRLLTLEPGDWVINRCLKYKGIVTSIVNDSIVYVDYPEFIVPQCQGYGTLTLIRKGAK